MSCSHPALGLSFLFSLLMLSVGHKVPSSLEGFCICEDGLDNHCGPGSVCGWTMGSGWGLIYLAVLGLFQCGGVLGNQFCRSGLSTNGKHCSGGCTFGFGTAKGEKACTTDILAPGLANCLEPSIFKNWSKNAYGKYMTCTTCKPGWSGTYCTRENIAYKSGKKLRDENKTTSGKVKESPFRFTLNKKRIKPVMMDLYPKDEQSRQGLYNCSVSGCEDHTWTSDGILRVKCRTIPKHKLKRFLLSCTNSQPRISLQEIKVYMCAEFWSGLETGCAKPCQCPDGVDCDSWNGTCPPGKEILTSTTSTTMSSTTSTTTSTMSSTTSTTTSTTTSATTSATTSTLSTSTDDVLSSLSTTSSTLSPELSSTSPMLKTSLPVLVTTDESVAPSELPASSSVFEHMNVTEVTKADLTTNGMLSTLGVTGTDLAVSTQDSLILNSSQPEKTSHVELSTPEMKSSSLEVTTTSEVTTERGDGNLTFEPSATEEATDIPVFTTAQEKIHVSTTELTSTVAEEETTTSTSASTATKGRLIPESYPTDKPGTTEPTPEMSSGSDSDKLVNQEISRRGSSRNGDADGGKQSDVMTEVWGAVGAIVGLVVLAVLAGIMYKKHRERKGEKLVGNDDAGCVLDMEMNDRTPSSSNEGQGESEYANVSETFTATTEPVSVDAFRNHVCDMTRVAGYSKEYQALLHGIHGPVTAAEEANNGNVRKNRFRDISPYDETRVVLKKEKDSDSDYINASYIDGFAETMAYIAAQGPLPETIGDFWHMVWTEGCCKIVMLTNLVEGAKVKCEQYWPETEGAGQTFGGYTVTLVKVVQRAHFVCRLMKVAKTADENTAAGPAREVQQFHFTAWPDHGVPCPVALVRFWSSVVLQPAKLGGPMLVHCSAGIGRTGTFIALDMLAHQVETSGKVSVFPTVRRLRKQRVNMVQTLSQYKFLHEVVQEWLCCRDGDIVRDDLLHGSHWKGEEGEASTQLPAAVRQQCTAQFQLLNELRPAVSGGDVATAKQEENASKNRSPNILPVEQYRVCLARSDERDSDYINAVFLPSLSRPQGYIVTQLPLDNTVTDFWRMVRDWRVRTVVRFMDAPQGQEVSLYPDKGQTAQHGTVSVHTTDKTVLTPGLALHTLHVDQGAGSQGREVRMYCVESQQAVSLKVTGVFVSLVNSLLPIIRTDNQPPIVLQCFDGAGWSCVLCALLMAVESLQEEERTSPFLLARLVHTARPQAFTSAEQYEFLVRCLLHHARGMGEEEMDAVSNQGNEVQVSSDADAIYGNV